MIFLNEIWQTLYDYMHFNLLTPNGYQKGGGLAVIYRNSILLTELEFPNTKTFEYMVLNIDSHCLLIIILIFRPPKQIEFFWELSELSSLSCAVSSHVLLLEDFNIHVVTACSNSTHLKTVLDCCDLLQNVNWYVPFSYCWCLRQACSYKDQACSHFPLLSMV